MLGLYVHLPFCRAHCAYCPFVVSTDDSLQDPYVDALVREIQRAPMARESTRLFRRRDAIADLAGSARESRRLFARDLTSTTTRNFDRGEPEDVMRDAVAFWRSLGVNRHQHRRAVVS